MPPESAFYPPASAKLGEAQKTSIFFRGLGNLGSKTIYLAGMQGFSGILNFKYGIVKSDGPTLESLRSMREILLPETILYVDGGKAEASQIMEASGNRFQTRLLSELKHIPEDAGAVVDFTYNAKDFLEAYKPQAPTVIQANQEKPLPSRLVSSPFMERGRGKKTHDPFLSQGPIFRAGDCLLNGITLALSRIEKYLEGSLFIVLKANRNHEGNPEEPGTLTSYFSDLFSKRKSTDLSLLLSGRPSLVTCITEASGTFYLAHFSFALDRGRIEANFGSWTKFEKSGSFQGAIADGKRISATERQDTQPFDLPPKRPISWFMEAYPCTPLPSPIILFRPTQARAANSSQFSFMLGFNANLVPAFGNLEILHALSFTPGFWKEGARGGSGTFSQALLDSSDFINRALL